MVVKVASDTAQQVTINGPIVSEIDFWGIYSAI